MLYLASCGKASYGVLQLLLCSMYIYLSSTSQACMHTFSYVVVAAVAGQPVDRKSVKKEQVGKTVIQLVQ